MRIHKYFLILCALALLLSMTNVKAWVYAETSCKQYGGQKTCVPPLLPKPDSPWKYRLSNSYLWGGGIYPYFRDFNAEADVIAARNSIDTSGGVFGAIGSWLPETCYGQSCNNRGMGSSFTELGILGTYDGPVKVGSHASYQSFFAASQSRQIYTYNNTGKLYFIQENLNRYRTILPFRCASPNQEPAYFEDSTKSQYPFLCALPPEPDRCEIKNPSIKTSCGNPIDFASGNKFQYETDWQSPNSPLSLVRIYNSIPTVNGLAEGFINPNGWQFKNLGKNLNLVLIHYGADNLNENIEKDARALYAQNINNSFLRESRIFISRPGQAVQYFYFSAQNSIPNLASSSKIVFVSDRKGLGLSVEAYPDGSWLYRDDLNGIYEVYNAYGQLVKILYKNGQFLVYSYQNNNDKIPFKIKDQFDKSINIQSDQNIVTSVVRPDGKTIHYGYDQNKALVSVQKAGYGIKRYVYGESNLIAIGTPIELSSQLLTGIIDEKGNRFSTYSYDRSGRGLTTEHADGAQKFSVEYANGTSYVQTPFNIRRSYSLINIQGRLQSNYYYDGFKTVISNVEYDQKGNAISYYKEGKSYKFTYDSTRNLETSKTEAAGTLQERKTETTWHADFAKPTEVKEFSAGQILRTTTYTYDNNGNVLTKTITDPIRSLSWTENFEYNTFGQITKYTNQQGATTFYQYSNNGDLVKTTDTSGVIATYSLYNPNGLATRISLNTGTVTDIVYDDADRIIEQRQSINTTFLSRQQSNTGLSWWQQLVNAVYSTVGAEIPYQVPEIIYSAKTQVLPTQQAVTKYQYDLRGVLVSTILPDGEKIEYSYDDAHRLTEIKDQSGNRTVYSLNANGDIIQTEVYGVSGQLEAKNQQIYDNLGRLKNAIGSNQQNQTITYNDYDAVRSDRNALDQSYYYEYDILGRQIKETNPLNGISQNEYNALDQLKKVTDAKGNVTTYEYDVQGNIVKQTSPDTGNTVYTYYTNGRLAQKQDETSKFIYQYIPDGKVSLRRILNSNNVEKDREEFTYGTSSDQHGLLLKAKNKRTEISFSYDPSGLVRKKTIKYLTTQQPTPPELNINYSYTLGGKLKQLALPSGNVINYDYNATGQMTAIRLNDQPFIHNIQQGANGVKGWTYSGVGDSVQYGYDLDGRITRINMPNVFDKNYSFDSADRILSVNDSYQSLLSSRFKHDALSRLTEQVSSNKTFKYSYDSNSNRLSRQTTEGTTTTTENYTIASNSNRLSNIQQGTTNKAYQYLATGQITSDGIRSYTYDEQGRSESISRSPNTILNAYNAFGQRIQKFSDNNIQILFVYDESGQLLGEYSPNGKVIREYIWLNETLVGLRSYQYPNEILRVHTDHLGTPRAISNNQNAVLWRWEGDQFGDVLPTGSLTFPIRHAGQYYDSEVGIFYNYFRDYDPITGRYIESDPIGLEGGLNTYGYVGGDALHSTDVLGLLPNSAQMACARNPVLCAEIGLTPKPLPKPMVPPIPLPIPKNPTKDENCDNNGNCATTYPNLKKCDVLRGLGYIYSSHSAAKSAKGWGAFQSHGQGTPAYSGPCIGYGTHTNIRKNGVRIGSIVSCMCCDDTGSGPQIKTIYKAL